MKRVLFISAILFLTGAIGFSVPTSVEIPGIGQVGIEKVAPKTYQVDIPKLGSYQFAGEYNSIKNFDMTASVPADKFTDYIPGVGQVLSVLGVNTVSLRLTQNGLGLGIRLESGGLGALRGRVTEALSRNQSLRIAINKIISQLEIRSLVLNGMVKGKALMGDVSGEISVIGKTLSFSADGEISFKRIVDGITDKIVPAVSDYVVEESKAIYNNAKNVATRAGRATASKAKAIYGEAARLAKDASASVRHSTHSLNKCLNTCTPQYADPQRFRMRDSANQLIQEFFNTVYADVIKIEGTNSSQTRKLREAAIGQEWVAMLNEIDANWQTMVNDDFVKNFAARDSSERQIVERYQSLIRESWNEHKAFREEIAKRLLLDTAPFRIARTPQETLDFIAGLAKSKTPVTIELKTAAKAWDIANHANGQAANGSQILFWDIYGAANQQWYLVPAGKPNTYHIQSAMNGKFLHISGAQDVKGSYIVLFDGASPTAPQTVYTVSADAQGYVHFITANGLAFDLENAAIKNGTPLRLWDNHGGDPEAYYIAPAVNPAPPLGR